MVDETPEVNSGSKIEVMLKPKPSMSDRIRPADRSVMRSANDAWAAYGLRAGM